MQLYKDSTSRVVSIKVPVVAVPGTFDVTIVDDDGIRIHEFANVTLDSGGSYSVVVPYYFVETYGSFNIQWTFDYLDAAATYTFSRSTTVEVVTPFLSITEVKAILGNETTDSEAISAERAVRLIICSHTGQDFSMKHRVYHVRGRDNNSLELPDKLITIDSVNGVPGLPYDYYLSRDGWFIIGGIWNVPDIKSDYYGLHLINGAIHNPNHIRRQKFSEGIQYAISGFWGWKDVPESVKEAAKLLLADYSCEDSTYRDRYLDAVSAVDWRIQFNAAAFSQTGNVRADQLLSNYILKRGWAAI